MYNVHLTFNETKIVKSSLIYCFRATYILECTATSLNVNVNDPITIHHIHILAQRSCKATFSINIT